MNMHGFVSKFKSILYLIGINFAVFLALFILFELVLHIGWREQNPLLKPPFVSSMFRIAHPVYGHTFFPNSRWEDRWGVLRNEVITNSLGFKDAIMRDVPLRSDGNRVLFLGDSFTEGIGLPYEQTFVGRFALAFPQLDVLNAAVASYAPSVYYVKVRYLLSTGLSIGEVIVYIDISDIQDEVVTYRMDENGTIKEGHFDGECTSLEEIVRLQSPWWARFSYTLDFLYKERLVRTVAEYARTLNVAAFMQQGGVYARDWERASWTYDANSRCYGRLGIAGGISKAIAQMDKLYALLSERHIPLSVGVYPWPQQLLYDDEQSRQVTIWRDWCKERCRRFFNHFPTMFAYKREHPNFLRELFIGADVHYNQSGNELIARDLIAAYP